MFNVKSKMNSGFGNLQGGLFSKIEKADVGDGVAKLLSSGVDILGWADPFFPDPSIPEKVKKVMISALEEGKVSHYSLPIGRPELRAEIAKKISRQTGLDINPSRNVIVTPGSDSGLLYALMPFISEGDEVLVPKPSYPSNFLNPKLLGGKTVEVPLYDEDNYAFRIDEFEKRVTSRTKVVLITHPNNPTTTVFRKENLIKLCDFVKKHDLILVSDQAFEDHIFDGIEFVSPATIEGMWERTLTVCSISKGIGLSGFRIGYIYASDEIMEVLYGGAVNVLGAASTLSSIGAEAIINDVEYLDEVFEKLERRRDLVNEVFKDTPGISFRPSESGILTWINVSKLGKSDDIANYLLKEANVLVNSGVPYGMEGYLRIVTACIADDDKARAVFEKMRNAFIKKYYELK
ncbi:aminotransferase [Candidatus Epulonipiscium fishelsonii]|uniref:Aminotransferase n=1 Tax=Candidatus Epulonipiscium fishelsonii TaxID=77094 RepID=A0ACC8XAT3_9FIRM|nr:aminotransferase [Epulopiscium sp. SCG-B05WGA-EpuloA1]ONI39460.1 aminotransferase [Epulopiscium sp. SCG-B11WGA-EpuloA1]